MSGIFPNPDDGAIAPGLTTPPSYDPTNPPLGTLARYFSEACGVKLRPEVLNAIISQIAAAIDNSGLRYDPTNGHIDLSEAMQYYLQKNMGAYALASIGPQDFVASGSPTFQEYTNGQILWLEIPPTVLSAANARLNVDGLGFLNIVRLDGSATVSGDLPAGAVVGLALRNNQWQLVTGGTDFMAVARARLPFYPHIDTVGNVMGVSSPGAGSVVVPPGVPFYHRAVFADSTDNYSVGQRTFATAPSKTYHLRWRRTTGFALLDLTDVAYNPTALAETDTKFDSMFDDMLVARVVTNPANVATVTNLRNTFRYSTGVSRNGVVGENGNTTSYPMNFSRFPDVHLQAIVAPGAGRDTDPQVRVASRDRYQVSIYTWGWQDPPTDFSTFGYVYTVIMPGAA